ncbi:hypothetical protein AURDEDRAFT_178498 [Auricularia subglabra TFB-10046 SS5]|uniref:Uncharacterized protein n=1 Tax=Auricularia subglabra (strain TFB-10046 / SS5) TaxID=717982 RepID=J0WJK1_AURST|nr:hypothetical protein AURDEDRAFT_178498 [Auricularia subglabra TFB-10046 SS5]
MRCLRLRDHAPAPPEDRRAHCKAHSSLSLVSTAEGYGFESCHKKILFPRISTRITPETLPILKRADYGTMT